MTRKARQATGDRNASRLYPERRPRGEGHSLAKLSQRDVDVIRERYKNTNDGYGTIAKDYSVTKEQIRNIVLNKAWV
jgi:DNA-directed RNA polymerase sigma subunit (sigma70/sigma32)